MRAILPGKPQSTPQTLCVALWDGLRVIAYLSGNTVVILGGPHKILQTLHVDDVDSLQAITIEEATGKIALCGGQNIYIYHAAGRDEGVLSWSQKHSFAWDGEGTPDTLSWGSSEELLVGGSQLVLWYLPESGDPNIIWKTQLASPVRLASFAYDAGIIASCGQHDRLVKVWRRLSYEVDSTRFDVSYLAHPTAVTNLHWRKPWHIEQTLDNLLYTFCMDNRIRVWAHSDPHARSMMQLIAEIDMRASIQPRILNDQSSSSRRYGFVIDSRDFSRATEKAVLNSAGRAMDPALEHLIEMANRSPEICVVLDDLGHLSAWGLENAGYKNRQPTAMFNVAHVDGLNVPLKVSDVPEEDYVQFCMFAGGVSDSSLTLLVHYFDGRVDWYDAQIAELFDPSARQQRTKLISSWSGHSTPVSSVRRAGNFTGIISYGGRGKGIVWKESARERGPLLERQSYLISDKTWLDSCILVEDKYIVLLHQDSLALWNIEQKPAQAIASTKAPKCESARLLHIPTGDNSSDLFHVAAVQDDLTTLLWEIRLPSSKISNGTAHTNGSHSLIRLICRFETAAIGVSALIKPIPELNTSSHETGRKAITQESLISLGSDGRLSKLMAKVKADKRKAKWHISAFSDTSITSPSSISLSIFGKAAIVGDDQKSLSIWNTASGELEYHREFGGSETIEKLAWASTPHKQSVLAVGFLYKVVILGQQRYSHNGDAPAWAQFREIRIRNFAAHPLGDLSWLSQGSLIIGAGNQMFVYDNEVELEDHVATALRMPPSGTRSSDLFKTIQKLNAALPIFHPAYLRELVVLGKHDYVHRILLRLHKKLKFSSEGDEIPSSLDLDVDDLLGLSENDTVSSSTKTAAYSFRDHSNDDDADTVLSKEVAQIISENLSKLPLWQVSPKDQSKLAEVVQAIATLEAHRKSVDENGFRYLSTVRLTPDQTSQVSSTDDINRWKSIAFASQSNSQEILVDFVTRSFTDGLTWGNANKSGMFLWLSDREAIRSEMEVVARSEYTKSEDRNPVDCSLFYIALRKKNVLQGLWRMATGFREKENTLKLLANNFEEARWKTTALKNAYALLSKRRFEYAAAFFLLGGHLKDAVSVCVQQLGKLDLGIAIARVYEGDDGPVLKKLLEDTILQTAAETGNRWMASWAFSMLGHHDSAIQALVKPLHTVIESGKVDKTNVANSRPTGSMLAKTYRANEPSLVVLYRQLRAKLVQSHNWTDEVISPREEWDFVMQCVRQYLRMGCDELALDLVRNWEFVASTTSSQETNHNGAAIAATAIQDFNPARTKFDDNDGMAWMLDGVDQSAAKQTTKKKKTKKAPPPPPPTQFKEPSANSLLDSFGF